MSSTTFQQIAAAANWHLRVNENFVSTSPAGLYGINPATTTGLTFGYLGGEFSGNAISNGTVTLTASSTNYVVALRSSGTVTVSTSTANWDATGVYMRLYQITTGASSITATIDKRQAYGGSTDGSGGGGGGAGAPLSYAFSTTTTAPPASAQIRLNNATQSASTVMYVHYVNADGVNIKTFLQQKLLTGDTIYMQEKLTPANWILFQVTGAFTDNTTYASVPVTWLAGGSAILNTAQLVIRRESASGAMSNPMTTAEDIIKGGASGTPARIAVGANGQVLTVTAGVVGWANSAAGFSNPMTAAGSLIKGGASGTPTELAVGTNDGEVLTVSSGAPVWAPPRILQNSQSAAYTLVASDAGKHIYHPAADTTARIWTIPANASVAFPIGTAITFDNDFGAGAITIAITSDTLVLVGTVGSTGSRNLASGGQATAIKVTSTRWRIAGTGLT